MLNPLFTDVVSKNNDAVTVVPSSSPKRFTLTYPDEDVYLIINDNFFVFEKLNGTEIDKFTIQNVIEYIFDKSNTTHQPIIEKVFFRILPDDNCELVNNSPFLNDIDVLIAINKQLIDHDAVNAQNYDDIKKDKLRKFICIMLEHTLGVISLISDTIKNTPNEKLKYKLMRYSTGIVYKMTQYLQQSLNSCNTSYKSLLSTVDNLKHVEDKLEQQLNL